MALELSSKEVCIVYFYVFVINAPLHSLRFVDRLRFPVDTVAGWVVSVARLGRCQAGELCDNQPTLRSYGLIPTPHTQGIYRRIDLIAYQICSYYPRDQ